MNFPVSGLGGRGSAAAIPKEGIPWSSDQEGRGREGGVRREIRERKGEKGRVGSGQLAYVDGTIRDIM